MKALSAAQLDFVVALGHPVRNSGTRYKAIRQVGRLAQIRRVSMGSRQDFVHTTKLCRSPTSSECRWSMIGIQIHDGSLPQNAWLKGSPHVVLTIWRNPYFDASLESSRGDAPSIRWPWTLSAMTSPKNSG